MTSKELNLKLIEFFPEIKYVYFEETSWQDGDETGSLLFMQRYLFLKLLISVRHFAF